jgi:hypothetical protein
MTPFYLGRGGKYQGHAGMERVEYSAYQSVEE